jgi:hypothetical protein
MLVVRWILSHMIQLVYRRSMSSSVQLGREYVALGTADPARIEHGHGKPALGGRACTTDSATLRQWLARRLI